MECGMECLPNYFRIVHFLSMIAKVPTLLFVLYLKYYLQHLKDNNLGYNYIFKHKALLEKRLLQGGLRLAGALNRIFNQ